MNNVPENRIPENKVFPTLASWRSYQPEADVCDRSLTSLSHSATVEVEMESTWRSAAGPRLQPIIQICQLHRHAFPPASAF